MINIVDIKYDKVLSDGKILFKEKSTFSSFRSMHKRCYNKKHVAYNRYGGSGVTVCERWHDFLNFYEDMGERPSRRHSIERIDNTKGYFPENCRWATREEQSRNKKTNRWITYKGVTLIVVDWEDRMGYPRGTIQQRLSQGWSEEKSIITPVKEIKLYTFNGKTQRLCEWAEELKIDYPVLQARLDRGWSVDKAFSTSVRKHPPFVCGEKRTYNKGCRCEKCKQANTEYAREYRSQKRK